MSRQLSLENARPRPQSRLLRAIRASFDEAGLPLELLEKPDELLNTLQAICAGTPCGLPPAFKAR
jgi:hypothetical protein